MTTDQLFDAFSEQIMQVHLDSAKSGVRNPEIRSVMTRPAQTLFLRHESFQHTYSTKTDSRPMFVDHDFEFRGSKVSLIPGSDIYFATRCTNLPPQ